MMQGIQKGLEVLGELFDCQRFNFFHRLLNTGIYASNGSLKRTLDGSMTREDYASLATKLMLRGMTSI